MNYLVLPTAEGVRGARAFLGWNQLRLADRCDVSPTTITSIENKKSQPTKELLETIAKVFLVEGIRFNQDSGFSIDKNIVTIYEGEDSFLKIQDDILRSCVNGKKEILMIGNEDKKSTPKVIEKDKELYKNGIFFKSIISYENDYLLGPVEDYRKIDKDYFLSDDVTVIYDNKVVLVSTSENPGGENKNIVINDKGIAERFRKYFYKLWGKGEVAKYSSAKQVFFKKNI